MKKLLLLLMSFLFVLVVNVGRADAVPDIRGGIFGFIYDCLYQTARIHQTTEPTMLFWK